MGKAAKLPDYENQRVATLHRLEILDAPEEETFDALTRFAADIFGTDIAVVSLVDSKRQRFLSHHGLEARETPREASLCAHAILTPAEVMVVPDALQDKRFRDNKLVTGEPNIRFYAGAPIIANDDMLIGAFCIIDTQPRPPLNDRQQHLLRHFAQMAMHEMELRKSREDALKRNRVLESKQEQQQRLLSMIGHDLRGSFNAILGFCKILSRLDPEKEPKKVLEYVDIVGKAGDRAHQLMDNLISWTAASFQDGTPEFQMVDIKGIIANAVGAVRHGAELKGVTIVDESQAARVHVNPEQIETVIRNLVSNGLKYTPPGGSVLITTSDKADGITVTICDTGIGMDATTLGRARNPDIGASSPGTGGEKGSGLGLLLCRDFLKSHGADLIIDSQPDEGSEFSFTLRHREAAD